MDLPAKNPLLWTWKKQLIIKIPILLIGRRLNIILIAPHKAIYASYQTQWVFVLMGGVVFAGLVNILLTQLLSLTRKQLEAWTKAFYRKAMNKPIRVFTRGEKWPIILRLKMVKGTHKQRRRKLMKAPLAVEFSSTIVSHRQRRIIEPLRQAIYEQTKHGEPKRAAKLTQLA